MNNRGQVTDVIVPIVISAVFIIATIIALAVWQPFANSEVFSDSQFDSIKTSMNSGFTIMDTVVLILFIFMLIGLGVTTYYIDTHPVFFIVDLIGLIFIIYVVPSVSNMVTSVMGALPDQAANFPIMTLMRDNFPVLTLICFVVFALGLYAKVKGGQYVTP